MIFKEWLKNSEYKNQNPLSVTVIWCISCNLSDLEGIEQFKNLEKLYCSNNKLLSLKGIEHLKKLVYLYCQYNNLKSLKGIEHLKNLKGLYFFENKLISLKEIIYLPNLKKLNNYFNNLEYKYFNSNEFRSIKHYQNYLKSFYRKSKIKSLI